MKQSEARADCVSRGGDLASIVNEKEPGALKVKFNIKGKYWIGLDDRETEGTWVWSNGDEFEYQNWGRGEPNNWGGNEDCVASYKSGKWNDENCDGHYKYICKYPSAEADGESEEVNEETGTEGESEKEND